MKKNDNTQFLFSEENKNLIKDPFSQNNPITVQVLGVCSALAVTAQLIPSIVMAVAVIFVTVMSNVSISLMRNIIPTRIRIIVELVIVACLVIVVDQILKAYNYSVSKQLSVFIGLIITNCIVMGRLESFALSNSVWRSFLDGLGNGLGYGCILIIVAFIREFLGSGSLFGFNILGDSIKKTGIYSIGYEDNSFMLLAPMALITLGIIIWIHRSINIKLVEKKK